MLTLDKSPHPPSKSEDQIDLPLVPDAWYCIGSLKDVARAPRRFDLPGGRAYVAFRAPGAPVAVLSGRCCHMGADLSLGCVTNGRLACPLHGWEFAGDGRCELVPAGEGIPDFARLTSFPVATCGGQVFFFNAAKAKFPLPFFRGTNEADLFAAHGWSTLSLPAPVSSSPGAKKTASVQCERGSLAAWS